MLTKEQIDAATAAHVSEGRDRSGNPEFYSAYQANKSFRAGVDFAQEETAPKWVPCKRKDILPEGYYMLRLKVKDIEAVLFQEINEQTPYVLYYNVIAYCRINIPVSNGK